MPAGFMLCRHFLYNNKVLDRKMAGYYNIMKINQKTAPVLQGFSTRIYQLKGGEIMTLQEAPKRKNGMKTAAAICLAILIALSLPACGSENGKDLSSQSVPASSSSGPVMAESEESSEKEKSDGDSSLKVDGNTEILVAYFSYGENAALPAGVDATTTASIQTVNGELTGNTGAVAHMIAESTGADLFSIQTVEKYPDTYDATMEQGQEEKNTKARPALASLPEGLDSYQVIFLGYPNWWGDMPMALYSFLDQVDLSEKTVIPFVTSGGSGFSGTVSTIQNLEPDAMVQEGISIRDTDAASAQEQVEEWLLEAGIVE